MRQIRGVLDAGFGTEAIGTILPRAVGSEPRIDMCPAVAAKMRRTLERIACDQSDLQQLRASGQAMRKD